MSWNLKKIYNASHRAANLSRQLLAFTHQQSQESVILDMNNKITGILGILSSVVGKRIEIELNLSEEPWSLNVVESDIDQILMNLVVNARDAMPHGGRLVIKTKPETFTPEIIKNRTRARPGSFLCLAVSDNGDGMDEETRQKIFKPFYSTKSKGKGTGLGLATVYRIVKKCSGWIEVESKPGRGTTFRVYLPVVHDPELVETN